MKKNIPILRKKITDLISELKMSPADALNCLEPICEALRRESRKAVEDSVNDFKRRKGIERIKTDY